ncbi:MAG: FkbM family methyltransferase [Bacteroidota bacterium]|nr:FkbM family methyltransferase [Bacteroidota bacterium]
MQLTRFTAKMLGRFRLLPFFNTVAGIRINGKRFHIPLFGHQGFGNLYLSEPWMTKILLALRPVFNGYFLDVGVNLGQTMLKAHAVFDQVNYMGFEPNPSCIVYAQELIRRNEFKAATLLPIAVGSKTEMRKLNFFDDDRADSSASIIENFRPGQPIDHYIFVPVFDFHMVSRFLPVEPYSILKIDVEGAELEVLQGLNEWIDGYHPIILMEVLPVYSKENQTRLGRQQKIEEMLKAWNYKIARIKKDDPVHPELIDAIGIHDRIEDCDYLLFPAALTEKISACFNALL